MRYIIILLLISSPAHALDWRIGTILGSEHWNDDKPRVGKCRETKNHGEVCRRNENYNEDNLGLYGCIEDWCAGAFKNSYDEDSLFFSHRWTIGHLGPVEFGVDAGIVHGYKGHMTDDDWMPYGAISAKIAVIKFWQLGRATAYGFEFTSDDWELLSNQSTTKTKK